MVRFDLRNCLFRFLPWACIVLSGVVSVLLGRTDELAVLQSGLSRTLRTGESGVVLVRGEPGIGKSTLLKAFAASVPDVAGGPVLVGYGQSMTHSLTRAVFRLRRYRTSCAEIDLPRLSNTDTRRLILRINTGRVIPDDQVQLMVSQSGGIPLYAESLALIRTQPHGTTAGVAEPGGAGDLPRKITAVMEERLSFAPLADQRLLEIAVGVGFTFEVAFVAMLARADLDEIYDRLDCLMREHHLIVEAEPLGDLDRYALYHPMLADVLRRRAEANAPRWRRYHQRLVDILLTQEVSDEIAVRAAGAAVTARDPRAAALALDAAHRQYRAGAVSQARQLAAAAMTAASGGPLYVDAAELLALCLSAQANHRHAASVCATALSTVGQGTPPDGVDPARIRGLMLQRVRSLRMVNDWTAAEDLLRGLEEQLPGTGSREESACRAEILMLRAETRLCGPCQDTAACIALCDRVIELSQASDLTSRALGHNVPSREPVARVLRSGRAESG